MEQTQSEDQQNSTHSSLLAAFMQLTNADQTVAQHLLNFTNWNLEQSLNLFWENRSSDVLPYTRINNNTLNIDLPIQENQTVGEYDIERVWPQLKVGVLLAITSDPEKVPLTAREWMKLYQLVYNHCTESKKRRGYGAYFQGRELYDKLRALLEVHVQQVYQTIITKTSPLESVTYYCSSWRSYQHGIKYVNNIFRYLNDHFIRREIEDGRNGYYKVSVLAMILWRDIAYTPTSKLISDTLMAQVQMLRNPNTKIQSFPIDLLSNMIKSIHQVACDGVNYYSLHFEDAFLTVSQTYYGEELLRIIGLPITDFMQEIRKFLDAEENRYKDILPIQTLQKLAAVFDNIFIIPNADRFLDEFHNSITTKEEISLMYILLQRIPLLQFKTVLQSHLDKVMSKLKDQLKEGNTSNSSSNGILSMMDNILHVFKKYDQLNLEAYNNCIIDDTDKAFENLLLDVMDGDMYFRDTIKSSFQAKSSDVITVLPSTFSNDIEHLYNEAKEFHYDIVFIVQNQFIYAHRAILSSRCPKFYNMELERNQQIIIDDYTYQIFNTFLKFLYIDRVGVPDSLDRGSLLTLLMEYGMFENQTSKIILTEGVLLRIPSTLSRDFDNLRKLTKYHDTVFTIPVEGQSNSYHLSPALKAIISSRSRYFRAMFSSGMQEANRSQILMPDFTASTMDLILEYLYTDQISSIHQLSADQLIELLIASNQCGIDRLKSIAERSLVQSFNGLDSSSILSIMQVAEQHQCQQLAAACVYYYTRCQSINSVNS